jgi:uncharacterized protein (DUF1499 family)
MLVVLIVGSFFYTLYRNDTNLFEDPGFTVRLNIYLAGNRAETTQDHVLKELRTPVFNTSAEQLYKRTILAASSLGWQVASHDSDNQNAHFVVYSPIFLFKDDVYVQVGFIDMDRSNLSVKSVSQRGKADLGANAGHIRELINELRSKRAQ